MFGVFKFLENIFFHFDDVCEEGLSKFQDEEQDEPGRKDGGGGV